jgi:FtsP/CotA-like multicopper oxidase with cupredoxin domain
MTTDAATRSGRLPSRPPARRRGLLVRLLLWAAVLLLLGLLGLAGFVAWLWWRAEMSNVGHLGFANQLKIPPLLEPRVDGAGRKLFDLRLQAGTSEVDDIPVVLQDKRFGAGGNLDYGQSPFSPVGRLGDEMLVNGTHDPHMDVGSQRVRFRLLNASTVRSYNIGFADDRSFELVATDGGLLERPHRTTRVPLSPGERAEVVAEFQPGERVVLRSFQPDLGLDNFQGRFAGGDDSFDLLQVRAGAEPTRSPEVPPRLARHARLDQDQAARTRRFELDGGSAINGRPMDMGRIDQAVTVNTIEVWEVANRSGNLHNFHVHDVQFKVVDHAGGPPPPTAAGWKDTVVVPPGATLRLVVRFTDYTDPASPHLDRLAELWFIGRLPAVAVTGDTARISHPWFEFPSLRITVGGGVSRLSVTAEAPRQARTA